MKSIYPGDHLIYRMPYSSKLSKSGGKSYPWPEKQYYRVEKVLGRDAVSVHTHTGERRILKLNDIHLRRASLPEEIFDSARFPQISPNTSHFSDAQTEYEAEPIVSDI